MKHNFKVGDRVVCLPKHEFTVEGTGGVGYEKGKEFIIRKITSEKPDILWTSIDDRGNGSHGVYYYAVKLISQGDNYEIY